MIKWTPGPRAQTLLAQEFGPPFDLYQINLTADQAQAAEKVVIPVLLQAEQQLLDLIPEDLLP